MMVEKHRSHDMPHHMLKIEWGGLKAPSYIALQKTVKEQGGEKQQRPSLQEQLGIQGAGWGARLPQYSINFCARLRRLIR